MSAITSTQDVANTSQREAVNMEELANLAGFPTDFVKKELLIEDNQVSMEQLRASMLQYLDATMGEKA
ncbi:hypothetical protein HBN50_12195 [Halobacteriovorax sp. GB3]|uniref:hypothetical protein n=1 Tax=Halobacteriovorax sp. GB3 TaxID=2719615 RepID=UPI002361DAA0|nr:hypothetical protein [Halobacteriovorax sp. GB3]MDD0853863.1 hypothetical protein [Halobacteriovorax sp. GB3]